MQRFKDYNYKVEIIRDYKKLKSLKGIWNRLARNSHSIYPFICFEWFDEWFKAFLNKESLHIYVISDRDRILAIAPFIKYKSIIGSIIKFAVNDHSHKIDIISDKDDLPGYIETLFHELLNKNDFYIYLEDLISTSETTKLIFNFVSENKSNFIFDKRFLRESVVVDTSIGWDNIRKTLSKKFRKNINHQRNRLEKCGSVMIAKYAQPENLPCALDCIEKISSKSWQGKNGTGLFSRKDTRKFYKGLAEFSCRKGWLTIWVLYLDNKPLAYEYHIKAGRHDYALKAEYDQEYYGLSPGAVLDAHIVKELSEGLTEKYNLLGFKERYKMRWSKNTEKYIRIYAFKRNIVGTIYHFIDFSLRARLRKNRLLRSIKTAIFK